MIAFVDLNNVRINDDENFGIEIMNEIDIWTQMEFRSRDQLNKLRHKKPTGRQKLRDLNSLFYMVREKLD